MKAIDTRLFRSESDYDIAKREIYMYRCIHQIRRKQQQQQQRRDERAQQQQTTVNNQNNDDISYYALPTIQDIFTNDDHNDDVFWYIVQDYVAGGQNLGMHLVPTMTIQQQQQPQTRPPQQQLKLNESQIRSLIKSILLALSELHDMHICHNDLRPENILVQRHQQHKRDCCWKDLKLCDLGRAKFVTHDDHNNNNNNNPRHSSLYYTAPEVILGHVSCSFASDMWSVGVILYQCFSSGGELPFRGYKNNRSNNNKVNEGSHCNTNKANRRSRRHSKSNNLAPSLSAYCPSLSLSSSSSSTSISSYSPNRSNASSAPPGATTKTTTMNSNGCSNQKISTTILRQQIKQHICQGDFNFGSRSWSNVSREAKQFISNLLRTDPTVRMTCKDALSHPWLINNNDHVTSGRGGGISGVSSHHYHHHPLYYPSSPPSSSSPRLQLRPVAEIGAAGARVTSMERRDQEQQQQHQYDAATAATGASTAASSADVVGTTKNNNSDDSYNTNKSMVHRLFGRLKKNNNNNKYHQNHQRHPNHNQNPQHQHMHMHHRSTKSDTSAAVTTFNNHNHQHMPMHHRYTKSDTSAAVTTCNNNNAAAAAML